MKVRTWVRVGREATDRRAAARTVRASGRGGRPGRKRQRGATLAEFLLVAPALLGVGGGTVQAGLAYHGKTVLNYATFEAARTGAVNHALVAEMEKELGTRLAPLQGGDGTVASAVAAIAKSKAGLAASLTDIRILNPTAEAFAAWQVTSKETGLPVIPNSHLRHRAGEAPRAGVTLQDANLLKIEVTHGFDLKVPLVGGILTAALAAVDRDPGRLPYYRAGLLPLTSVATVRMQSEVWGDDIVTTGGAAPGGGGVADQPVDGAAPVPAGEPVAGEGVDIEAGPGAGAGDIDLDDLFAGDDLPSGELPLVEQHCS